jgi:HSP20 family protein
MNIVKWDPFKELEDVSNRLNRIFSRSTGRAESGQEMLTVADWSPTADISETDNAYLIRAEIPGVKKEDVKVSIQDDMLTMQGERKMEKEEKGKKFHRIERSYGNFVRSFRLPDDADENAVNAEFKDGMLNVLVAKSTKAGKNKAIDVAVT